MEYLMQPSALRKPIVLSRKGDKAIATLSEDILQSCRKQDLLVIDFLYKSYRKRLNGVILNIESDFNPQLQVSVFLRVLSKATEEHFNVIVLCPNNSVIKWHYYFSQSETFKVCVLTEKTIQQHTNGENETVLLVTFSNLKLLQFLTDLSFSSIIVDNCDEVMTKMALRKLQGSFNVGTEPNQKLQWLILNWSNPGCMGKIADFYQIDNDNFAQFRDNYKEWWFRLTWNFCDSFIKPSLEEKGNLSVTLREWAKNHNLSHFLLHEKERKRRKRKSVVLPKETNTEKLPKRATRLYNTTTKKTATAIKKVKETAVLKPSHSESNFVNSSDTIIYKHENILAETTNDGNRSSDEQVLLSLIGTKTFATEMHTNKRIEDDESDLFLKSVAASNSKQNHLRFTQTSDQFINQILSGDKPKKSSEFDELKIFGTQEELGESNNFLKGICSLNEKNQASLENNNYASTSTSDVDALIAEAMELVRKW
ncbi:uncharacterized protein [Euwallacea similis]|uniref:uncharacterized protein isoform X2 n=1 Tax=Euwallacea similis TaxID=1736056 RepID=UPI00344F2F60